MNKQLLIADADGYLSDLYLKYFGAHGYCVRVASGGVECLTALRETPPDVLVLDTELKWGGADGVLSVMDEEDGLSAIPVVLLNDSNGMSTGDKVPLSWSSTPIDDVAGLNWPAPTSISSQAGNLLGGCLKKSPVDAQVVDRLLKPFYFQKLLDSIGTATTQPTLPR